MEAPALEEITIINQKECLRWVASALVESGISRDTLCDLYSISAPERFKRALHQLSLKKGGANSSIGLVADVLAKLARYSGALTAAEIKEVNEAHKHVRKRVKLYMRDKEDRDQKLLDDLDDPKVVDALLTLARRTVTRVLKVGRKTYRAAIQIQMALIVEIWLCAPLRLKNMRHLRLDHHFFRITFGGEEYFVIRVPAAEIKNKNKNSEHLLNADSVDLLHLYIEEFLPILTKNNPSPFLFPGRKGKPKAPQVFRSQTSTFVFEGTGLKFHPHAIRKITTKLYLDEDPGGIEVVRRSLGDTLETTRGVYAQRVHRASQRKYVNALENRRLAAFSPVVRVRRHRRKE